ncbi:MAG: thioredoxin [Chthoniobacteraceae bacterium]
MYHKLFVCAALVLTGTLAYAEGTAVRRVAEKDFDAELAKATTPVVVDFYADWCGPCRLMSPIVERQAAAYSGKITFFKVNVDQAPGLSDRLGIEGIPALFFFKKGKVADSMVGLVPEAQLKMRLDSLAK